MAGTVADYQVLSDGQFSLKAIAGQDTKRISFNLPGKLHRGGTKHHGGIFAFGIYDAKDLDFDLILNGKEVYDSSSWTGAELTSDSDRTFQEAFPSTYFNTGNNDLTIQIRKGSGTFHDLIVWFQRDT
ncbi:MAG: hypothetical protein F6K10_15770 [Moorea sp. SIO2B7]|nr:hypothetical protein [Moorena sp. SIO2B7]